MEVQARSVILQMVQQVLSMPMDIDIYTAVSKSIAQNCVTARGKLNELKGKQSALERHRKRTKLKPAGKFIEGLFDQVEAGIKETSEKVQIEIDTLTRAAEMFQEACDPSNPDAPGMQSLFEDKWKFFPGIPTPPP